MIQLMDTLCLNRTEHNAEQQQQQQHRCWWTVIKRDVRGDAWLLSLIGVFKLQHHLLLVLVTEPLLWLSVYKRSLLV